MVMENALVIMMNYIMTKEAVVKKFHQKIAEQDAHIVLLVPHINVLNVTHPTFL